MSRPRKEPAFTRKMTTYAPDALEAAPLSDLVDGIRQERGIEYPHTDRYLPRRRQVHRLLFVAEDKGEHTFRQILRGAVLPPRYSP